MDHAVTAERPLTGALTIGRLADNDLVLEDALVSGHHGRLERDGAHWRYTDLGSVNGSVVAAGPVLRAGESVLLTDDCQILLGNTVLDVRLGEPPEPAPHDASGALPAAEPARPSTAAPADVQVAHGPVAGGPMPPARPAGLTLEAARPRMLVVLDGHAVSVPLRTLPAVIGRGAGCEVRIEHPSVSARHAELALADGRFVLRDLGSTNGTRAGLLRVTAPRPVRNGTHIIVGDADLLFVHDGREPDPDPAETRDSDVRRANRAADDQRALDLLQRERRLPEADVRRLRAELAAGGRQLGELLVAGNHLSPGEWMELALHAREAVDAESAVPGPRGMPAPLVALALFAVLALGAAIYWLASRW